MTLSSTLLLRLAGARAYGLGQEYVAEGRVGDLAEHGGTIMADVRGSTAYRVRLQLDSVDPDYDCSCPVGDDGIFCKHCVAAGLAWLAGRKSRAAADHRLAPACVKPRDVRARLNATSKESLIDLIMELSRQDNRVWRLLLLKTVPKGPRGPDIESFRRALDEVVEVDDFVDYRVAGDYAHNIEEVIDAVEGLLKKGHAADVVELAEHALAALERAIESVDDSDGYLGGIFTRLQCLHHQACRKARPDPAVLAKRLFQWEMRTDWDVFHRAATTYADVLGKTGLAAYRKLAEAHWAGVPAVGPDGRRLDGGGDRLRITTIMEALAELTDDVGAIVAVKQRDLSLPYHFLEIAELYRKAGKADVALEWAERGQQAFPKSTDTRLREFLAEEYYRGKRYDEAMALIWAGFLEAPWLSQFQNLKKHATRIRQWPAWRKRALDYLRDQIALPGQAGRRRASGWPALGDHSELVRIHLWEKDPEMAWTEARDGGCSDDLWLALAAQRARDHPADALVIYRRRLELALKLGNNHAYREAIGLVRTIRALMVRLKREEDFAPYLETIRATYKRKRNFMKMLERAKWRQRG